MPSGVPASAWDGGWGRAGTGCGRTCAASDSITAQPAPREAPARTAEGPWP